MSKSDATENDVVKFIFNATAMPAYGAILYVSLHTSDPGEAGDQTTNETAYTISGGATPYTRQGVTRDTDGWFVATAGLTKNLALIQFPVCTGNPQVVTHVAIGTLASGAGQILYSGALNESLSISNLVQPQFAINMLQIQED